MAQPQEYTVKEWKPWENEDGLIRDIHGNYKGSVTFEEDRSEPIDATFKNQPEPGDKKYGVVDMYTTRAGKVRKGFKSAQRPQESSFSGSSKREYQPRDDAVIRAQWAIGQAVQIEVAAKKTGTIDLDAIQQYATDFYIMVDRVKGSSESTQSAEPSGYEKAKAVAGNLNREPLPEPPEDQMYDGDGPINLDDIPF